jgi:predicted MFS family arabinose efflux permease
LSLPLVAVVALGTDAGGLGLLRAVEQAPILLLSLFAGAWVDRLRARDVMVLADGGRALALAAIGFAYPLGVLGIPMLCVTALAVGALGVFFDVAYQTALVRLVAPGQLVRGNSALEGSRSAAQIGGPALGGVLVSAFSAPLAAAASVFFFAASLLSIRRIRRPEPVNEEAAEGTSGLWRRIHEGLRLVAADPSLRAVGLASALFQFSFAALLTVYLVFLPRGLHLSGASVGLVLAALGPGAVVGSLLAARLPGRYGYGRVLVGAAALGDGVLLCVPALPETGVGGVCSVVALMGINFLFGTCGQLVNVTMMAVRQTLTPVRLQGRVVATVNFVGMGLTPLGSLLGGHLAGLWGLRTGLLVTAVAMLLSPLFMALSPLAGLGKEIGPGGPGAGRG